MSNKKNMKGKDERNPNSLYIILIIVFFILIIITQTSEMEFLDKIFYLIIDCFFL